MKRNRRQNEEVNHHLKIDKLPGSHISTIHWLILLHTYDIDMFKLKLGYKF